MFISLMYTLGVVMFSPLGVWSIDDELQTGLLNKLITMFLGFLDTFSSKTCHIM